MRAPPFHRPAARAPVWVTALVLVAGCGGGDLVSGALSAGPAGQRVNVLLVTLDTTRADRLGCYGHADARTPHLDRLAREGIRFADAQAPAPLTLPSHASLMTGAWPPEHGIRDNGRAALGPGLATMAEAYRDHGFRTGAVVASFVLDGRYGLGRGFDWYEDDLEPDGGVEERRADRVVVRATRWLAADRAQPFFLWVHFFDPHAAYAAPQPFSGQVEDPYDAEVAFVDAALGRLLVALEEDGRRGDTLVIVVGDHGEGLGEHGEWTHSTFLYDSTLRVPFLMHLPGRIPAGRVVSGPVSPVDLLPTLLDLHGWERPADGRSLVPIMGGDVPGEGRALYAESEYASIHYGWAPLRALVTERWKYIRAPRPELYDRREDPGEERDLAADMPDRVAALDARLAAMEAAMRSHAPEPLELDGEAARHLAALGYLTGDARDGPRPGAGVDPKDRIEVLSSFHRGMELLSQGMSAQALEEFRGVVESEGEAAAFRHQYGVVLAMGGEGEEARVQLEAGLALSPSDPDLRCDLGKVLLDLGLHAEAEAQFRLVLEVHSAHLHARRNLVALLDWQGRAEEAARVGSGGGGP